MAGYNFAADYKVIGRIKNGTIVEGYIIADRKGNKKRVNKSTFEQMALQGNIYNCNAQVYQNNVNLRGIGEKLTDLPSYKKNGRKIN